MTECAPRRRLEVLCLDVEVRQHAGEPIMLARRGPTLDYGEGEE